MHTLAFYTQIWVWKSQRFSKRLYHHISHLTRTTIYTFDLTTCFRGLNLCLRNLHPKPFKNIVGPPFISSQMKRQSNSFYNDFGLLYYFCPLINFDTTVIKNTWKFITVRNKCYNFLLLWLPRPCLGLLKMQEII